MKRENKSFSFSIKSSDDEKGIIEGYLSVFNNVDQGKDRVLPGAFKRTLQNSKKRMQDNNKKYLFPVLWQHDPTQPVGGCTDAKEDGHGLYVVFELDLDTQKGRETYSAYKKGYMDQLSIGYDTVKYEYDSKGIRDLIELRLWEGSTVTFAMNEEALVNGVKSRKDFNDAYRAQQIEDFLYSDLYNICSALKSSLMEIFSLGDTPEPDLVNTILDDGNGEGLISALKAWVQKGIDLDVSNYLDELQQSSSNTYSGYMGVTDMPTFKEHLDAARRAVKAGTVSPAMQTAISDHTKAMHDLADQHKAHGATMAKAMHSAADDLATVLQGSEPSYTTDPGSSEQGTEKASSRSHAPSSKPDSSITDTQIAEAINRLTRLQTTNK